MVEENCASRRGFLKFAAGCACAPAAGLAFGPIGGAEAPSSFRASPSYISARSQVAAAKDGGINIIGPRAGYSPQVGTLVSMLMWMQTAIGRSTEGITQANLDYLFDAKANTIGALMLHLAATEIFYQANTFEGKELSEEMKRKWGQRWN